MSMKDVGFVSIYANLIAVFLCLGVFVLLIRFKMKDPLEKKIYLLLLGILMLTGVSYMLVSLREEGLIFQSYMGAMFIETVLEMMINLFAFVWLIYVEYRMFHSPGHIRRNLHAMVLPALAIVLLNLVNMFTGILFTFDEAFVSVESPFYIVADLIRLGYFISSLIILGIHKKKDERMRFFSLKPFVVPMMFYILLYYFTPYPTVALGMAIGLALIYAEMVNETCYMDRKTGFYNRRYMNFLKGLIDKEAYDLKSVLTFTIPEDEVERSAALISAQLPESCDTIRYATDRVIVLSGVQERGPLHMLSEDVEASLQEAKIPVESRVDLKKKNETAADFFERYLRIA